MDARRCCDIVSLRWAYGVLGSTRASVSKKDLQEGNCDPTSFALSACRNRSYMRAAR
jgi:hypothetical protein